MPGTALGTLPCFICRSLEQMLPRVTRTMASVASCSYGLGLSIKANLPFSMYVYAFILNIMLLIFCSHRLWQLADYKLIRLFYPRRYGFCGKLPIIHVAPMLLVPMKRWGHRRISLAQRLVSLRSQFTCKPRILTLHAEPTSTQPKAQKNLAFNTKGDNVVAKRLILSHTKQRQSVFPDLLDIHKALFFSFFRRDTWRLFLIFRRRSVAIFALRTVLAKEYYHHNLIYRNYATEKYILAKYHKRSNGVLKIIHRHKAKNIRDTH